MNVFRKRQDLWRQAHQRTSMLIESDQRPRRLPSFDAWLSVCSGRFNWLNFDPKIIIFECFDSEAILFEIFYLNFCDSEIMLLNFLIRRQYFYLTQQLINSKSIHYLFYSYKLYTNKAHVSINFRSNKLHTANLI